MYYHMFNHLGEPIKGYSVSNIRKLIASKNCVDRKWDWNYTTKVNSLCSYRGECGKGCIFYKVTWKACNGVYIGKTHNTRFKNEQHLQDIYQKVH